MKAILTIAIPTYNHHELLLKQIRQINSLKSLSEYVDLIVLDNCSTPAVESYLIEKNISVENFKIITQAQNIGAEKNILQCFKECQTDWLWVLSDNDLIHENAVNDILNLIKEIKNDKKKSNVVYVHLGQGKTIMGNGLKEFCKEIFYPDSFSISHCLYHMPQLRQYLRYYEQWTETMQGQILFVMKCIDDLNCSFLISDYKPCYNYLPSEWNKRRFIKATFKVKKVFKNYFLDYNTIKENLLTRIFEMLSWQLLIARAYQNMKTFDFAFVYIRLFYFVPYRLWFTYFRRTYRNVIKSIFDKKYYLKQRREVISIENDFKEI